MLKTIDIISAGEILIDFIGNELNVGISNIKDYHKHLGGSPTNLAINGARLGLKTTLIASCGKDGFGDFMVEKLKENNVDTRFLKQKEEMPTSVIFVSKSTDTPEFIAYRNSDYQITHDQISDELLNNARVFHTTCFGLSKNPARDTILDAAGRAAKKGLTISIDFNFSDKIWPNRKEAEDVLKKYLSKKPLVKISEDDCFRFFGEVKSDNEILEYFHSAGAATICYTKGKNGVVVSDTTTGMYSQNALHIPEVKDTTGAGDAFWTGFLYAYLHYKKLQDCVAFAQQMAGIKLQRIGGLPINIDATKMLAAL
ncbi:fructokinase [Neptunitalea chrysea]|uniref:Fructokinase n=1 Tax=Neptunitalea chrysea TaxID=1647581 RepID=A0A9W6ETP9_9FLAO|nr:carbohydrate kinase [Neptunitalea chrysea]GLB51424.1 fructokinase [Neptunitalea chrysea]